MRCINTRFPDKSVEMRPPPRTKCFQEIVAYHAAYDNATKQVYLNNAGMVIIYFDN